MGVLFARIAIASAYLFASTGVVYAQAAPKCESGYQPFAGRCVSNPMSDYIACVEVTGGGKQEFRDFISAKTNQVKAGSGGAEGSGAILSANGSITLKADTEQSIVKLAEAKFFAGAMSECAKALQIARPATQSPRTK